MWVVKHGKLVWLVQAQSSGGDVKMKNADIS